MPFDIDAEPLPEPQRKSLAPGAGFTAWQSETLGFQSEIARLDVQPGNTGDPSSGAPFDSNEIKESKPEANRAEAPATDAEAGPSQEQDAPTEAPAWCPGRRSEPERPYQRTPEEEASFEAQRRAGRQFLSGYAIDTDGGER